MIRRILSQLNILARNALMAVPVGIKIAGIFTLPVLILGFSLNYWITTGLSDWLSYILTDERVAAAMSAGSRSVILVTVLAAFLSLILSAFLSYIAMRPLHSLRETAEQVAGGKTEVRARVWANDEIGQLARSFNGMVDHLVRSQHELARQNRRLAFANTVAAIGNHEGSIHDALFLTLKHLADTIEIRAAWVFLYDPERRRFHLATWHTVPEQWQPLLLDQPNEACCACQAWLLDVEEGQGHAIHPCERLKPHRAALPGFDGTHATVPLVAGGRHYGVLNVICASRPEASDDDFRILDDLGPQLSEIVDNAWLQLKLSEKEQARQALLKSLVKAQEDERLRLARELHDGAGQTLTSLLVRLRLIEKTCNHPEVDPSLRQAQAITANAIEEIRAISHRLRPAALEQFGLESAVRALVDEMSATSKVRFETQIALNGAPLTAEAEIIIYRIAQEGLNNALRHAEASHVRVDLRYEQRTVHLRIEDNGRGFDPMDVLISRTGLPADGRGIGLLSMHERAELAGGQLVVSSGRGAGTTIMLALPLAVEFNA